MSISAEKSDDIAYIGLMAVARVANDARRSVDESITDVMDTLYAARRSGAGL